MRQSCQPQGPAVPAPGAWVRTGLLPERLRQARDAATGHRQKPGQSRPRWEKPQVPADPLRGRRGGGTAAPSDVTPPARIHTGTGPINPDTPQRSAPGDSTTRESVIQNERHQAAPASTAGCPRPGSRHHLDEVTHCKFSLGAENLKLAQAPCHTKIKREPSEQSCLRSASGREGGL